MLPRKNRVCSIDFKQKVALSIDKYLLSLKEANIKFNISTDLTIIKRERDSNNVVRNFKASVADQNGQPIFPVSISWGRNCIYHLLLYLFIQEIISYEMTERSAFNLKNAFKKLPKGIDRISHSVYAGNIK